MDSVSKFYTPGAVFVLTLVSGFWLSHLGKPLNSLLFTIHKLIALGAVILIGRQVYQLLKVVDSQSLTIVLMGVTVLCVVALFATGALMSMDKPAYDAFLTVHKIAPVLMVMAMGAVIYGSLGIRGVLHKT